MRQQDILKHSLQVLTNEQRRFYFDNGYLLVERCLDDDTVNLTDWYLAKKKLAE